MRKLMLVCMLLIATAFAQGTGGALDLIHSMDLAVSLCAKGLQDGGVSASSQQPLFGALKNVDSKLEELKRTFPLQNKDYFAALRESVVAVAALRQIYNLSGLNLPTVDDGISRLEQGIRLFESNFSNFAVRARQGGPLTNDEREQLVRLQQQNQTISDRLAALERAADPSLKQDVQALRAQAQAVARNQATLNGYVTAMQQSQAVDGAVLGLGIALQMTAPRYYGYVSPVLPYSRTLGDFVYDASAQWQYGRTDYGYWNTAQVQMGPWSVYNAGFVDNRGAYDLYLAQNTQTGETRLIEERLDVQQGSYDVQDVTPLRSYNNGGSAGWDTPPGDPNPTDNTSMPTGWDKESGEDLQNLDTMGPSNPDPDVDF